MRVAPSLKDDFDESFIMYYLQNVHFNVNGQFFLGISNNFKFSDNTYYIICCTTVAFVAKPNFELGTLNFDSKK